MSPDSDWQPDARRRRLLAALPDAPRWVEARALLVTEWATLREDAGAGASASAGEAVDGRRDPAVPAFVLTDPFAGLAIVCGQPAATLIAPMPPAVGEVIAYPDNVDRVRAALPGWSAQAVRVRVLDEAIGAGAGEPTHAVALIDPRRGADLPGVPAALREELLGVVADGLPLAAAFDGARAVAFCHPAACSGRYWDLAIDTVASHRRRGYAQAAVRFMVGHMRRSAGLEPVWCDPDSNPGSARLAQRLGFVETDRIWLLSPSRGA